LLGSNKSLRFSTLVSNNKRSCDFLLAICARQALAQKLVVSLVEPALRVSD
jgi:hypothetical protein